MTGRNNEKQSGEEFFDAIVKIIGTLVEVNTKIIFKGLGRIGFGKNFITLMLYLFSASVHVVKYDFHLKFLIWLQPKIFNYDLIVAINSLGWVKNTLIVMGVFYGISVWFAGLFQLIKLRRYQNALDSVHLKNGQGSKARVVDVVTRRNGQKIIKVFSQGIGMDMFQRAKDALESAFSDSIETIQHAAGNMRYTEIILGITPIPKKITFEKLRGKLTKSNQFLIGAGRDEVFTEKIDTLPHLLIAGTTGGGKSVFFKQVLFGLLETTDNLQMYLIDLKGGLEFKNFRVLPNVKVVKTIEDAVSVLTAVKSEMDARFSYLEESEKEKIITGKDPFDRIIVGIDEASVLYSNASRDSDDYELIAKARSLTEYIAKLSRAAGIHLIMATQKVTKETIDTRIQENISGRMCFKLNTLEGSLRVLGNGSACNLPNYPGRGIWLFGNKSVEVQNPLFQL